MDTQTINISLPKKLIEAADEVAEKEFRNRSELIREALRKYINESSEWEELFAYSKKQAEKAGVKSQKDVDNIVADYRQEK